MSPFAASAQYAGSPLSPAGRLRLDVSPTIRSWDSRFGLQEVEPLGADLTDPEGVGILPAGGDLEGILEGALSGQDLALPFGFSQAQVSLERVRLPIRLDLGIFEWLTVGVTVPLEKGRSQVTHLLPADSSQLGVSPALSSPETVSAFLDDVARALEEVRMVGNLGVLEGDLERFRDGLIEAYETSALFPAEATAGGQTLLDYLAGLNTSLSDSGIGPVQAALPLAAVPVTTPDGLDDLLVGEGFLYRQGLEPYEGLWALGDVEVHAAVRLLEGAVRDSIGAPPRIRWLLGVEGLVRLPTGTTDDPDVLLDFGSGDGQTDIEGGVFAHLAWGRLAASAEGRFGRQLSTTLPRRVAPPDEVLPPLSSRRMVEWSPGDYVQLSLVPRLHLTPELSLTGTYRYTSKGAAEYRDVENAPANEAGFQGYVGPSWGADVLGLRSDETVHEIGLGMTYSTLEAWREARVASPVELSFAVRSAVSGSGGLTPKALTLRLGIRVYRRLWGG